MEKCRLVLHIWGIVCIAYHIVGHSQIYNDYQLKTIYHIYKTRGVS